MIIHKNNNITYMYNVIQTEIVQNKNLSDFPLTSKLKVTFLTFMSDFCYLNNNNNNNK